MIRGVLFDMDGLLLDTERLGRDIHKEECAALGYPGLTDEQFASLLGNTRDVDREIMKGYFGPDFPYDVMYERYRQRLLDAAEEGTLPCRPGMAECLKGLKARGLKIALATSTQRSTVELYQRHIPEMNGVFDAMVCGKEGGRSKPAPDIYLKAASLLGLEPGECVGAEDSLNGLKSLRAAGAVCVMVPDLLPRDERFQGVVDYELKSLHELCPLVDQLNGEHHA